MKRPVAARLLEDVLLVCLLVAAACQTPAGAGGDSGADAKQCSLDTVNVDCAASCGAFEGGTGGTDWPCKPDPLCVDGRWKFDCVTQNPRCVGGGAGACTQPGLRCLYPPGGFEPSACCCVAPENAWACYPTGAGECYAANIKNGAPCCGPGLATCPSNSGAAASCQCVNFHWQCK